MERTTTYPPESPAQTPGLSVGRLIVGHEDDGFLARVCRQFQEMGWEVYPAETAADVRRLATAGPASVVILPTEFGEESGWLTCAKLVREHPRHRVILVGQYTTPALQRYTSFVGGTALLGQDSSMRSLVDEVHAAAQVPLVN
ncbi:hypothetical protein AYO44_04145 [Planctomycetaceae bacterium SCGC AG-212-F19]|nr:hypothetical protein AYO44_04145 [Planctomycetaceae bacterium SCGC AG-212-F19]